MIRPNEVTEHRNDISRFMVHLTRDDSDEWKSGGGSARKNFLSIFRERRIMATNPHCLHANRVGDSLRKKLKVSCFSEMPLNAIRHATKPIKGRKIQLEPYGFVFSREFILENGGQEVTYVNSYGANKLVREGYDKVFEIAKKGKFKGEMWKVLPFLSAMHERCDFHWEREFRILGDLKFKRSNLICVILPEEGLGPFKFSLAQKGVAWISTGWGYEKIVEKLADQQRRTKRLKSEKLAVCD